LPAKKWRRGRCDDGTVDGNAAAAVSVLLLGLAVDVWIFIDARGRSARGEDVVATIGPVTLSTAEQWLIGCLLLWVIVVPLYLVARRA
jgi:hypothetical protein